MDADLFVGYGTGTVRRALESGPKLAANGDYQEAVKDMPGDRVSTVYINLQKIIELARTSADPFTRSMLNNEAARHLRYLTLASTQNDDRIGGVLFLRISE